MPVRASALLFAATLAAAMPQAQPQVKLTALLDGKDLAALEVKAPLQQLFEKGSEDENVTVPGIVTFKDPQTGSEVVLRDVEVSVRGHTSRRETECSFPKLKLKLKGAGSIKIGTHCGESPDAQLTTKYGRLANEKSPHREALAYQMLAAAGVPTLRTRAARVTYVDPGLNGGQPLARNALLLEDDDDAMKRVGGTTELTLQDFGDVAARKAAADAGLIAFGEAMIGNFDWCLKFSPDDLYRCNEPKPLWNVLGFDKGGSTALVMKDFDLAGVVVGAHGWFDTVWNRGFVPSKAPVEIEVLSQVQRTRSLFPRDELDRLRKHFVDHRDAVLAAIGAAVVDDGGRELARSYANHFFAAIADDRAFYRPIVTRTDVQVYMDAAATREACGVKDVMRPGTPVNEIQRSGTMSQVVILDVMWRWASKNECNNVQDGPVWIASDAITSDYPPKTP
jgi:hypothetical protein